MAENTRDDVAKFTHERILRTGRKRQTVVSESDAVGKLSVFFSMEDAVSHVNEICLAGSDLLRNVYCLRNRKVLCMQAMS